MCHAVTTASSSTQPKGRRAPPLSCLLGVWVQGPWANPLQSCSGLSSRPFSGSETCTFPRVCLYLPPPPPATPLLNHDHDNPWRHPMPSVSLFLSAGLGAERFPPLPARQWRPRLVRRELKERMRQQGKIYAIFACRPVCLSLSLSLSTR